MKLSRNRQYLKGALSARDFLRRTQQDLQLRRQFEPKTLRWEYHIHIREKSAEYQAGFLDALGVLLNLYQWEVLRDLERADQQN